MKKLSMILGLSVVLLLSACGETATSDSSGKEADAATEKASSKGIVKPEEFDQMYSSPKEYEGYTVEFTGQVFAEPERDADGIYLQVYAKPEDFEQNVIVGIEEPDLKVATEDYVKITGTVKDQMEGENALGGVISAPIVLADTIEVVDYITAVSPTIKEIAVDAEQDQHGFLVNVQKIEVADNQTRVYVKVTNNTSNTINFYDHSTKLIVENKQFEPEYTYETGLPEVQSEILPGIETEGIIIFPAIEPDLANLKFYAEGYSDDYETEIEPFTFDIQAQ
ncbi:DUF4352 domain-containing protein [Bhargavaea beijingensis]|uniref:DUF4352 domain-containing protein n=1 Tax=Bhargavaea beijingensis TaxID=426756 RepID=A0ABX9ZES0_9BACL|nr:DUF4352 domain-containing protein [Bhargavaea beijingensis]RSK35548.1 DUF4352 domain-containing protein [Bhargavaea beijingensis]